MALVDKFYDNVESLFAWLEMILKHTRASYCDIETANSRHVLVNKDNSLLSIIQLNGFRRFVGSAEFQALCDSIAQTLQSAFLSKGHGLQFYFSYEPDEVAYHIDQALEPAVETAHRLGLDIADIFGSKKNMLTRMCAYESCFIVVRTDTRALPAQYIKKALKQQAQDRKGYNLATAKDAQNIFMDLPELNNLHDSLVSIIIDSFRQIGFYLKLMDVHEALYEVRRSIDANYTSPAWRAYLPGDPLPVRHRQDGRRQEYDISELLWPPLANQLIPREGQNIDLKMARIGDMLYLPMYIELFPKSIRSFYDLFKRVMNADLPWRISYMISDEGIKVTQSKNWLAQFLTFSSYHNKLIVETHKYLKMLEERGDDPIVKLKVVFTTWAHVEEKGLLKQRAAKLAQLVQGWGGCEVKEFYGDPFGEVMGSSLAIRNKSQATASAPPLSQVIKMLPITRPASPWQRGAILFRTPDGKLWPYQPGSSHQISWVDIIYARSGSGKSVLLNSLNLGLCLSPGLSQLPRIAIIDIGPSSKGFISLLKEGLSAEDRDKVAYHRLKLEDGDAINPFDTQLGIRLPTKLQRSFLINLLSLLYLDNVADSLPEGMSGMLSMIVDEVFRQFSDHAQPKPYIPDRDVAISERLKQLRGTDAHFQTWWQVVDYLFDQGDHQSAMRAQTYAMPTLSDTISAAHSHGVKDIYGKVCIGNSAEDYVSAFCRNISVIIRNYPTSSMPTQLHLEKIRVLALDLEEVAKTGSAAADKQTSVMYMLARHAVAQHYFLRMDEVMAFPERYRAFHTQRVREILEEPKRIVYDEFHRTARSVSVREQVIQDMREGRKWKIQISLASQALEDFDKLMVDFATSIFILDSGSSQSIEKTCKTFGLNETEKQALATQVHGPTSMGATFIAQFVTKQGINTQLLTSSVSAVELWAFNTTSEDVHIRELLYKALGPKEARRRLAERFPSGTAVRELELMVDNTPQLSISAACEYLVSKLIDEQ
ncbi:MAG: AAA family ATPase [Francisellaceae bacterium]